MKLNLKIGAAIVAVAGLTGSLANASVITVTGGAVNYSLQGETIYGSTGVTTLPPITVLLNADYTLQDNIQVVITGATVGGNTNAQLNVNGGSSGAPANGVHCWAPATVGPPATALQENSIIVSLVPSTPVTNTIALRVTQKNVASSVGNICRIQGIDVTSPSIAKLTTVAATWNALTATTNIPFDSSGAATTVAQTISQFTLDWGNTNATRALSGIVDVTSGRKNFFNTATGPTCIPTVTVPCPANNDITTSVATDLATGTITAGLAAAGNFFATGSPVVTLNTATETLTGNFGELTGVGGCTPASAASGAPAGFTLALATSVLNTFPAAGQVLSVPTNCQTIVSLITPGGNGQAFNETYTFTGGEAQVMSAPQTFTSTVQFAYTGAVAAGGTAKDSVTLTGNPGAWTLNGFNAFVSYMPFGTGISQVVYLSNKSTQTGGVTIVGYTGNASPGNTFTVNAGTIGPGTVMALSAALVSAVNTAFPGYSGKVSFNVIANIPAGLAELYTSYNVNNDRVNVVNTSNGRVTQTGNSTTGGNL
jgi:hypothetical protein